MRFAFRQLCYHSESPAEPKVSREVAFGSGSRKLSCPPRPITRYAASILLLNLAWETLQLPLYTIWAAAGAREIVWTVLLCTIGDVSIAAGALAVGWLIAGRPRLVTGIPLSVGIVATLAGVAFTLFSEWRATQITHAWEYSELMPVIPGFRVGLSPLLEWIILPPVSMWLSQARIRISSPG